MGAAVSHPEYDDVSAIERAAHCSPGRCFDRNAIPPGLLATGAEATALQAEYSSVKKIGAGTTADVHLVRHNTTGELIAVKCMHKRTLKVRNRCH